MQKMPTVFLPRKAVCRSLVIFQTWVSTRPLMAQKSSMPAMRIRSGMFWYRLAIRLRQIDMLSRPKDSALPGPYIGRYSPQPQSHIERIDAKRGPEGELADPMLFRMAGCAQRNSIAIAWLPPHTTIGSSTHMCGV